MRSSSESLTIGYVFGVSYISKALVPSIANFSLAKELSQLKSVEMYIVSDSLMFLNDTIARKLNFLVGSS